MQSTARRDMAIVRPPVLYRFAGIVQTVVQQTNPRSGFANRPSVKLPLEQDRSYGSLWLCSYRVQTKVGRFLL